MGRPREYDQLTAEALLEAAELLVADHGLQALSVRTLTRAIGTSIRPVYTLFGSKDGLVIALGTRAFQLLSDGIDALATTEDPAGDLVEAGVVVFRRFTRSHPALFTVAILRSDVPAELAAEFRGAQENALSRLHARVGRLRMKGQLGSRSESLAVLEFHALCEGLAALESRGILGSDEPEETWRDALKALVAGWAVEA